MSPDIVKHSLVKATQLSQEILPLPWGWTWTVDKRVCHIVPPSGQPLFSELAILVLIGKDTSFHMKV